MEVLGRFVMTCVGLVITTVVQGYVLGCLWGWFVIPVFGLSHLRLAPAIGIATIAQHIGYKGNIMKDAAEDDKRLNSDKKYVNRVALSVTLSLIYLLIGWIASRFM